MRRRRRQPQPCLKKQWAVLTAAAWRRDEVVNVEREIPGNIHSLLCPAPKGKRAGKEGTENKAGQKSLVLLLPACTAGLPLSGGLKQAREAWHRDGQKRGKALLRWSE